MIQVVEIETPRRIMSTASTDIPVEPHRDNDVSGAYVVSSAASLHIPGAKAASMPQSWKDVWLSFPVTCTDTIAVVIRVVGENIFALHAMTGYGTVETSHNAYYNGESFHNICL